MGFRVASVWVKYGWVSLSKVVIVQWYKDELGIDAVQFEYEGSIYESYIEYVDLESKI
jgi:hypothetical protein